jgi:hypothetical protein
MNPFLSVHKTPNWSRVIYNNVKIIENIWIQYNVAIRSKCGFSTVIEIQLIIELEKKITD